MTYKLPEVLSPDEFGCVRIYYPKHAGYLRAVLSAVSYLQHWYAWERDEYKGGKTAAEKFREAYGLTIEDILAGKTCDGTPDNDQPPICKIEDLLIRASGAPSSDTEGEEDMGQIVTDVTIENGKLTVWYGPCCSKVLGDASSLTSTVDDTENVPDELQPEETGNDRTCQKAWNIVNHLFTMLDLLEQCVLGAEIKPYPFYYNLQ